MDPSVHTHQGRHGGTYTHVCTYTHSSCWYTPGHKRRVTDRYRERQSNVHTSISKQTKKEGEEEESDEGEK